MLAARALRDLGPAPSERIAKQNVNKALDQVAARLGNTRAVCRKYYVHPAVQEAYLRGIVPPAPAPPQSTQREQPEAALRREEYALLAFLQSLTRDAAQGSAGRIQPAEGAGA